MTMRPAAMSYGDLAQLLRQVADLIEEHDSFEGYVNWLIPDPPFTDGHDADVTASFRVGNRDGQGGTWMIGTVE